MLDLTTVPDYSSLCKAFDRLSMAEWRCFLAHTRELVEENGVVAADASGFDRSHASRHYTKRTDLNIQQLKVMLLVDTKQHAVVDVHVTTTRKHDTKIAPTLVQRNEMQVFLADKDYDATALRKRCRAQGIRPLIRYREFTSLQAAWNARMDDALYQQRNLDETVYSTIKRRFGSAVATRIWWKQFREIVVKCIAHNLEKAVGSPVSLGTWYPPSRQDVRSPPFPDQLKKDFNKAQFSEIREGGWNEIRT